MLKFFSLVVCLSLFYFSCSLQENEHEKHSDASLQELSSQENGYEKHPDASLQERPEKHLSKDESFNKPDNTQRMEQTSEDSNVKKCQEITIAWRNLDRTCRTNEDCTFIFKSYSGNCECSYGISNHGLAVSKSVEEKAKKLASFWLKNCKIIHQCTPHADIGMGTGCKNGICQQTTPFCP